MQRKSILFLLTLLTILAVQAQTIQRPNPSQLGVSYQYVVSEKGIVVGTFNGKPPLPDAAIVREKKAIKAYDTLNHKSWTYDPSVNDWLQDASGGAGATIIPAGPTTSVPSVGFNPGNNISVDSFIKQAYYASQSPNSGLGGGQQLELMATGPALQFNLTWSAGRNIATNTIQSIVVAGVNQTFTTPAAGATISGIQLISVARNINTTYSNIVTTTDNKTATSGTSFTFLPKRYFGWVNTTTPTDANIIAAGGELSSVIAKSWVQSAPTGNQYLMYAYPAAWGALNRFDINTFPSLGAMQLTQRNLTNASGYTQLYDIYVSTNAFNVTATTSVVVDGGLLQ